MGKSVDKVCEIIDTYSGDTLVPLDGIKKCIAIFEEDPDQYSRHIELLRSQIGVWGSDDTSLFSAQLVASRLKTALLKL